MCLKARVLVLSAFLLTRATLFTGSLKMAKISKECALKQVFLFPLQWLRTEGYNPVSAKNYKMPKIHTAICITIVNHRHSNKVKLKTFYPRFNNEDVFVTSVNENNPIACNYSNQTSSTVLHIPSAIPL